MQAYDQAGILPRGPTWVRNDTDLPIHIRQESPMPRDAGERPLDESGEHRQDQQVEHITDTGNEATEPDEETVLAELYGTADTDGVYRGVGPDDGE